MFAANPYCETADVLKDFMKAELGNAMSERTHSDQKPKIEPLMNADKISATEGQANLQPAAQPHLAKIGGAAAGAVPIWGGPTDGMRAVGTGSPSPAVTPPPVMQREGPAEDREILARLGVARAGTSRGVSNDAESDEARLRDAAEVSCPYLAAALLLSCFGSPV